jgi:hypothetical protein
MDICRHIYGHPYMYLDMYLWTFVVISMDITRYIGGHLVAYWWTFGRILEVIHRIIVYYIYNYFFNGALLRVH